MAKQATKSDLSPFTVQVTPNSTLRVVWARPCEPTLRDRETGEERQNPQIAIFSAELVVDGVKVATLNSLKILETHRQEDGAPITHIGSMYEERGANRNRIYSITLFPGSNNDAGVDKMRSDVVGKLVTAVTNFMAEGERKLKEREAASTAPNPQLAGLRQIVANRQSNRS